MELSAERKAQIADIKRVCGDDLAYKWSIDNNDIGNMMIVMRAWGFEHTLEAANRQLKYSGEVTA